MERGHSCPPPCASEVIIFNLSLTPTAQFALSKLNADTLVRVPLFHGLFCSLTEFVYNRYVKSATCCKYFAKAELIKMRRFFR